MIQHWGHLSCLETAGLSRWTMWRLSSGGGGGGSRAVTTRIVKLGHFCSIWQVSPLVAHTSLTCGTGRAITGAFEGEERGLNLIFQMKSAGGFGACARRSLGVRRRPLSVHPVKGLSAAGGGVESEGSSRVHTAPQECLCLSARRPSGVVQLVRGEGEAEMVFMQLPP